MSITNWKPDITAIPKVLQETWTATRLSASFKSWISRKTSRGNRNIPAGVQRPSDARLVDHNQEVELAALESASSFKLNQEGIETTDRVGGKIVRRSDFEVHEQTSYHESGDVDNVVLYRQHPWMP